MKNNKLPAVALAMSFALLTSCGESTKPVEVVNNDSATTSLAPTPQSNDEIVTDTTKDSQGKILISSFNNTKGTVTLVFNGEKIEMTQDTTASGAGAHNDHYEYTSWHGETELKKDGKVVFSVKE